MSKRRARVRASYILYLYNGRPREQSRLITQTPPCKSTVSRWNGDKGCCYLRGRKGQIIRVFNIVGGDRHTRTRGGVLGVL